MRDLICEIIMNLIGILGLIGAVILGYTFYMLLTGQIN